MRMALRQQNLKVDENLGKKWLTVSTIEYQMGYTNIRFIHYILHSIVFSYLQQALLLRVVTYMGTIF